MKSAFAIILMFGLFGTVGFAQPTVSQISNAASASLSVPAPQGGWNTLPNGSIAQGSYFTVYGNGFGGAAAIWNPYPLPTEVGGTSVSVTVGQNPPVAAYIEFAAQLTGYSQLNAILPSSTPIGPGTLTVTYNGQTSAAAPINVVASSFGTFAQNQAGDGPGIITDTNYAALTPSHTAKPGQVVILWGTGLGPAPDPATEATAPPCPDTCDLRGANLSVTVWVGNQQANLYYAGRSGYTGEDEIIFYVPTGVTTGCHVSVAVQTGPPGGAQTTSNFTTMPLDANGATCQEADDVNMNDIAAALQSKGSANVAAIGLLSNFWNVNLGGGTFIQWDNDIVDGQIGTYDAAALDLFRGFTRLPSVNSCTAIPYLGYPPPADYGLGYVTYLDAGPALTIQGPLATKSVAKNSNGNGYDGLVGGDTDAGILNATATAEAPFYWDATANGDGTYNATRIASGNYIVTGPGGAAVNALTGTIDVSSAAASFVWTNESTFANQTATPQIFRNTPLNITWTGGDPQGFVDITLIGSTVQNTLPSPTNPEPGVYVECVAPASAGSFNVPTYVLAALPAGGADVPLAGLVLVGPASAVTPIAPPPTGLDAAFLYYRFLAGYTVEWQ
ncbi:MAG: hypothetical protein ABSF64_16305 [Bryobacteraceae bacterium]|jgi:uncharacterized protein (TIGR03437 family)